LHIHHLIGIGYKKALSCDVFLIGHPIVGAVLTADGKVDGTVDGSSWVGRRDGLIVGTAVGGLVEIPMWENAVGAIDRLCMP
jgi:hypothetical protein